MSRATRRVETRHRSAARRQEIAVRGGLTPPLLNCSRRPIFVCAERDGAAGNLPALPTHVEEVKDEIVWLRYRVAK